MANNKLFIGKANYEFGTRYVLLHIDSAVCINFSNPVALGNYLLDNYGRNFHRKVSYNLPENNEIEKVNSIREEKGLDELVLATLRADEAKVIDDVVDKIDY